MYVFILFLGNVVQQEASDHAIKSYSSNVTYLRGYVDASDYAKIRFKDYLTLALDLGSYNSRDKMRGWTRGLIAIVR